MKPVKHPAPTQDDLIAALAPDAAAADKWAGNQVQGAVLRLKLQAGPEFMAKVKPLTPNPTRA